MEPPNLVKLRHIQGMFKDRNWDMYQYGTDFSLERILKNGPAKEAKFDEFYQFFPAVPDPRPEAVKRAYSAILDNPFLLMEYTMLNFDGKPYLIMLPMKFAMGGVLMPNMEQVASDNTVSAVLVPYTNYEIKLANLPRLPITEILSSI